VRVDPSAGTHREAAGRENGNSAADAPFHFCPEFSNRRDNVFVGHALSRDRCWATTFKELDEIGLAIFLAPLSGPYDSAIFSTHSEHAIIGPWQKPARHTRRRA
jgi:hypothetical protein